MKKEIHILGSGPMGLGVAFYAIKKGYKPIIYEADDRIGGMTASFDFNGLNIERFYHFHCKTDHDFFNILDFLYLIHWFVIAMDNFVDLTCFLSLFKMVF